jgi:hypothetical protein
MGDMMVMMWRDGIWNGNRNGTVTGNGIRKWN